MNATVGQLAATVVLWWLVVAAVAVVALPVAVVVVLRLAPRGRHRMPSEPPAASLRRHLTGWLHPDVAGPPDTAVLAVLAATLPPAGGQLAPWPPRVSPRLRCWCGLALGHEPEWVAEILAAPADSHPEPGPRERRWAVIDELVSTRSLLA